MLVNRCSFLPLLVLTLLSSKAFGSYFDRKPTLVAGRRACGALLSSEQRLKLVGVLAMTDQGRKILGLGDYFGSRHYPIMTQIEAAYGNITRFLWLGELELAPVSSSEKSAFAVIRANETAGLTTQYSGTAEMKNSVEELKKALLELRPGWIHPHAMNDPNSAWIKWIPNGGLQHLDERLNEAESGARHFVGGAFRKTSFALEDHDELLKEREKIQKQISKQEAAIAEEKIHEAQKGESSDPDRYSLKMEDYLSFLNGDLSKNAKKIEEILTRDFSKLLTSIQLLHDVAAYEGAPELAVVKKMEAYFQNVAQAGRWNPDEFRKEHGQDWKKLCAYMSVKLRGEGAVELIDLTGP